MTHAKKLAKDGSGIQGNRLQGRGTGAEVDGDGKFVDHIRLVGKMYPHQIIHPDLIRSNHQENILPIIILCFN
jgi:hypothetical protein